MFEPEYWTTYGVAIQYNLKVRCQMLVINNIVNAVNKVILNINFYIIIWIIGIRKQHPACIIRQIVYKYCSCDTYMNGIYEQLFVPLYNTNNNPPILFSRYILRHMHGTRYLYIRQVIVHLFSCLYNRKYKQPYTCLYRT